MWFDYLLAILLEVMVWGQGLSCVFAWDCFEIPDDAILDEFSAVRILMLFAESIREYIGLFQFNLLC